MACALDGYRILDLTRVFAGPYCTMTLGDLGAEVIKIEEPRAGDDTRHYLPKNANGESVYFLAANRNKKSVTVDLRQPEGQAVVRELARASDVLVENYRYGALAKFGLDYPSLAEENPRLVYCSISGFGRESAMRHRPGYDFVAQAEGGLMSVTGEPDREPVRAGVPISDIAAGMWASQAILAALLQRERTGQGQFVDISLLDSVVSLLPLAGTETLFTGMPPRRVGNAHPAIVPYQVFPASDGHFVLAVANDGQFRQFCQAVGRPDLAADPRFAANAARVEQRAALVTILTDLFAGAPVGHWVTLLEGAGVPCARIRPLDEVLSAPEVIERGMVRDMADQFGTRVRTLGSPLHMSGSAVRVPVVPPLLGQDTDTVLSDLLGYDAERLAALRASGIIGAAKHPEAR